MRVIIKRNGNRQTIQALPGETAALVLRRANQPLPLPCGGYGRCGKCRVKAGGGVGLFTPQEMTLLTERERASGIRLSCQCTIAGDAELELLPAPDGAAAIPRSDTPRPVRGMPMFNRYGLAVDVGTTTLAAQIFDGRGFLCEAATLNPQAAFGADVISRIEQAMAGNAPQLAKMVREGISGLVRQLCEQAGITTRQIDAAVLTGNTTMLYLLNGYSPKAIAAAPFAADHLFGSYVEARTLALPLAPDARIYQPRCISAFVGADITLAAWLAGLHRHAAPALLADIGTNGEIALWTGRELVCASTAAGPAFEGAGIYRGMLAAPGAICTVAWDGNTLHIATIGDMPPLGICGSGVISLTAALLRAGWVNETGRLLPERIPSDMRVEVNDAPAVLLGRAVPFTQKDVRMLQLAKSALSSGIAALLDQTGIDAGSVTRVCLSGGFGQSIDLDSAIAIGLIPKDFRNRVDLLGNASLGGSAELLMNVDKTGDTERFAASAQALDLSSNAAFREMYMRNMLFSVPD